MIVNNSSKIIDPNIRVRKNANLPDFRAGSIPCSGNIWNQEVALFQPTSVFLVTVVVGDIIGRLLKS